MPHRYVYFRALLTSSLCLDLVTIRPLCTRLPIPRCTTATLSVEERTAAPQSTPTLSTAHMASWLSELPPALLELHSPEWVRSTELDTEVSALVPEGLTAVDVETVGVAGAVNNLA